ncbi:MAG: hypothetical protein H0T47_06760 [Planctomycetaceae bacterium]|nr:hypothetical protein [Planctomycetaceae bacterium]
MPYRIPVIRGAATSVRVTVTAASVKSAAVVCSVALTVSRNDGVVSKSSLEAP